jgi:hypothetical protein
MEPESELLKLRNDLGDHFQELNGGDLFFARRHRRL